MFFVFCFLVSPKFFILTLLNKFYSSPSSRAFISQSSVLCDTERKSHSAGLPGLEPGKAVLETAVIPFHHSPIFFSPEGRKLCLFQFFSLFVFRIFFARQRRGSPTISASLFPYVRYVGGNVYNTFLKPTSPSHLIYSSH